MGESVNITSIILNEGDINKYLYHESSENQNDIT